LISWQFWPLCRSGDQDGLTNNGGQVSSQRRFLIV
jgi:hypothetical protein